MSRKFNWRAFTSLYIILSFIIMAVSGLILFIAPPGRIANWTNLTILGLTKSQWQALHTVFTILFILAAAFHIYFNWRPLMAYLRTRVRETLQIRKEFITSGIVVSLLVVATLTRIPPFSSLMELSEDLSYAWSAPESEPPVPHAELLTIAQLAQQSAKTADKLIQNLYTNSRIQADSSASTLGELAAAHGKSPQELYNLMFTSNSNPPITGGGYGRMTIRELAVEFNIPVEQCLLRLHRQGIETGADVILRELADRIGKHPHDILNIIRDS